MFFDSLIEIFFEKQSVTKKGEEGKSYSTVIIHCEAELAQRNGTLPPPPGLISDSVNIVHSAIKVHCAAGESIEMRRKTKWEKSRKRMRGLFDC